jgi:hypothetical protein
VRVNTLINLASINLSQRMIDKVKKLAACKLFLFPFIILCFHQSIIAQDTIRISKHDLVYIRPHTSLSLKMARSRAAQAEHVYGEAVLNTFPSPLMAASLEHTWHFSNRFGFCAGIEAGAIPLDHGYTLEAWKFSSLKGININESSRMMPLFDRDYWGYLSIPFLLNYHRPIGKKVIADAAAGIRLMVYAPYDKYTLGHYYSLTDPDTLELHVLQLNLKALNSRNPYNPGLSMSAAVSYILPNLDLLSLRLSGFYSGRKIIQGSYCLLCGTPEASRGNYSKTADHIGLGLVYTRTRAMKQVRRMKQESNKQVLIH